MSEWDDDLLSDRQKKGKQERESIRGPLDLLMISFTLGSTAAASFIMAYLTKDIPSRPFWMLALCFAVPVTALMLSAWFKEKTFPRMTPNSSRKAQLVLALCSILAAAIVGCFCQVTNQEAKIPKSQWSSLLIILDKSGSMSIEDRDRAASQAVKELISKMDDNAQVAMLINVGWEENNTGSDVVPLSKRRLDFAPLGDQREKMLRLADFPMYVNENFPRAFDIACEMLDQHDRKYGNPTVLVLSDGDDITGQFHAIDYLDQFRANNAKMVYLYVDPAYSGEMMELADSTGGSSVYISDLNELTEKLQEVVPVSYFYEDALRSIDKSTSAKIVTAVLLLLLGMLIGFSLTVMFSLQGQKRAQLILSPFMALFAFLLLAFGKSFVPESRNWIWIREGIAFTLLGIVVMRCNRVGETGKHMAAATPDAVSESSAFSESSPVGTFPSNDKKTNPDKKCSLPESSSGPDSIDDLW